MQTIELLDIISTGETSKVQFKEELPHNESMAKEIVAMSNSLGGMILLGIEDITGTVVGVSFAQVEHYDKVISQIADNLKPPVYLTTEVIKINDNNSGKNVLLIHIQEGVNKPYKTEKGEIYIKQGSNKRLLTDNAEIMRLFQRSGNLLAYEMEVYGTSITDIDEKRFSYLYLTVENVTKIQLKMLPLRQAINKSLCSNQKRDIKCLKWKQIIRSYYFISGRVCQFVRLPNSFIFVVLL